MTHRDGFPRLSARVACGFPPTRRIACAISMGHYQRSLVLYDLAARRVDEDDPVHVEQQVQHLARLLDVVNL